MIVRYAALPTIAEWWDAKAADSLAKTVHEPERRVVRTGVLNAKGVELVRVEEPRPIGFTANLDGKP